MSVHLFCGATLQSQRFFLAFAAVRRTWPGEEIVERGGDLFIAQGIVAREKHRCVRLARVTDWDSVEIAGAVRGKAKALAPTVLHKIHGVLLAFQIERQEGLDPFRSGIAVGAGTVEFEFFAEDRFAIVVQSDEPLRQTSANSLLHFGSVGMDEAAAEEFARGLALFGRLPVTELVEKTANAGSSNKQKESESERSEDFDQKSLRGHEKMIQDN